MSENRSDKELAFLHDLYVATDWGERFAELFDAHVKLPKKGRALYVGSGTGGHALKLAERAGEGVTLVGVDEHAARVEISRAKAAAVKLHGQTEFHAAQLEALDFEDEQFDVIVCDASLIPPERLPEVVAELLRVAAPGATVSLSLATASSYGEFFSLYWEALLDAELADEAPLVAELISRLPVVSDVTQLAEREGLESVQFWTNVEEFHYATAEEFLSAPLVRDFLLRDWLEPLPDEDARTRAVAALAPLIDEERNEADFILSIKATLVAGRKTS